MEKFKISKIFIHTKCPYCGYENRCSVKSDEYETTFIFWCRKNFGGCGKAYVIKVPYEIKIQGKAYKIENNKDLIIF